MFGYNGAHLHLLINHIPVLWLPLALGFLAVAMLANRTGWTRAALAALVVVGVFAVVVYLTGEPAEDTIEHMAGVSRRLIHEHEEAGELATIVTGAVGGLALLGLLLFRRALTIPRWFTWLLLISGLVGFGLMARAANLGGVIRHPEIRSTGATIPEPDGLPGTQSTGSGS